MSVVWTGILLAAASAVAQAAEFEVASVKPDKTHERMYYGLRDNRLLGTNMTAKGWIQIAYQVRDFQVSGGPSWISSETFNIEAKAPAPAKTNNEMLGMLRALLAEHFKLAVHQETKEASVYNLVIARSGLRMNPSANQTAWIGDYPDGVPEGMTATGGSPNGLGPDKIGGDDIPMTILTNLLSNPSGRIVVNKTGLKGRYAVDLHWTPDLDDSSGVSMFTAIQEQLGLRLAPAKGPVDIIVVDHIERPGEN